MLVLRAAFRQGNIYRVPIEMRRASRAPEWPLRRTSCRPRNRSLKLWLVECLGANGTRNRRRSIPRKLNMSLANVLSRICARRCSLSAGAQSLAGAETFAQRRVLDQQSNDSTHAAAPIALPERSRNTSDNSTPTRTQCLGRRVATRPTDLRQLVWPYLMSLYNYYQYSL
jgi:hypothetical protein